MENSSGASRATCGIEVGSRSRAGNVYGSGDCEIWENAAKSGCNGEVWPDHWAEGRDTQEGPGSAEGGGLKSQVTKPPDRLPYPREG